MSDERVGQGEFLFEPVPDWAKLPEGWAFVEAVGVATNSKGEVFVFDRGPHPVIVLDRDGNFLRSWGEGRFRRPHGIFIGPDDSVYLTDDHNHTVEKFSPEGELLLSLGKANTPSATGIEGLDYRTITASEPFNLPTNLALDADGEMFVTDGYGNARVHHFSSEGELLHSWGERGAAPGEFHLPHGICVDGQGRVIVADRENSRLQFFSRQGEFLEEWDTVARPCEVFTDGDDNVFVAELGWRAGVFPWMEPDFDKPGGRVSIYDSKGKLLSRWGGGDNPLSATDFYTPHDIWLDAHGDMYVGEVVRSAVGGYDPSVVERAPTLRKFRRVA